MIKSICLLIIITIAFHATSETHPVNHKEAIKSAKEMTYNMAYELGVNAPKQSKFETDEDYIAKFQAYIPNQWYFININFEDAEYDINKKRFFWDYEAIVDQEKTTPEKDSAGVKSYLREILRVSFKRNIKNTSKYAQENSSLPLMDRGYEIFEKIIFPIKPELAQKLTSAKLYFKINTISSGRSLDVANSLPTAKTMMQGSNVGISKDAILEIDNNLFQVTEKTDWEYSSDKGFEITQLH